MRWLSTEVDTFLTEKEYVDTAIVNLIPISLNGEMKQVVSMGEFSTIISSEIEKQLHGRTFILPPFTYLKSEDNEDKLKRVNLWLKELVDYGFKHIFLFTSDHAWKEMEARLANSVLVWLPALPLEHMDDQYKMEILQDQTKQILKIVTNRWQTSS